MSIEKNCNKLINLEYIFFASQKYIELVYMYKYMYSLYQYKFEKHK